MDMEQNDDLNWGIPRRPGILLSLGLGAASAILAGYIGAARVELREQSVLEDCQTSALAWLEGTGAAVERWQEEMKAQRLHISGSETYRLFAGDLVGAGSSAGGAAVLSQLSELSEEIAHLRGLLKGYADQSGFSDVRIIGRGGHTLLSAQSVPSALSHAQREAAARVMESGRPESLPVRPCTSGLMLDSFEPMLSLEEPHSPVAVFMASRPVLADFTQFSARPKPEELAVAVFLQRNEARAKASGSPVWETVGAPQPKPVDAALSEELEGKGARLPLALRGSVFGRKDVYSAFFPLEGGAVALEIPSAVMERRMFLAARPVYIATFLGWLAFLLLCQLIWWIGMGRHQKAVAARLKELNRIVSRQKELLDSVNISLDIGLFMADVKGQIHVCNRAFASIAGHSEESVQNQPLFSVLPSGAASALLDRIRQTAIGAKEDSCELKLECGGEERLFRVSLFPFLDAEESSLRESLRGAVVTMKDITEFRRRSERQRQQQKGLVEAFTRVEASADPYLAGHSHRMAALGELIAQRMGLPEDSRNTVVMGAQLSQIGKLFLPRDLLTKSGKLTAEELAEVRKAPEHALKLLENIDFDLPVARALHEMNESPDGSGYPRGLKDGEILHEARILAVLNAFCAMVSARSYREGKSVDEALKELRNPARFDQAVVEQLAGVLETTEGMKAMKA